MINLLLTIVYHFQNMTKALKLTFPRIASTKRCVASLSFVYQIDIFKNCGPYCHSFTFT